ncbi:hypothetical protein K523DRAFT_73214 [Schizophyllum commune Tattone D]|nr:hypothetical protein K523DRAFT_73214 [Schizophyllum commune Tattone D]
MRARLSISVRLLPVFAPAGVSSRTRTCARAGWATARLSRPILGSICINREGRRGWPPRSFVGLARGAMDLSVVRWVSLATRLARRTRPAGIVRRAHRVRVRSAGHTNVR